MFFKDIIGHHLLKDRLIQTVHENRVGHAWLFFGNEGTGALPMALAYAGYILCSNRQSADACGHCISCNKTGKYIHPDLHFVLPVNKTENAGKDFVTSDDFLPEWRKFLLGNPYSRLNQWYDFIGLENKQGIISTEESKRLAAKLALKSFESDYKVVIIWQPEKMNNQASNKLLKLLEEPPPLTIFLLVAENPEYILATIRSRCIPVKIPRIADEDITNSLVNNKGLAEDKAREITRIADGNYLRALELSDVDQEEDFNVLKFRELMRSCFKGSIPEIIRHSDEYASLTREKQKSFLECGLRLMRECLAIHFNNEEIVFISGEETDFVPKFAPFITGKNITPINDEITSAIQDIERNGNSRMIMLDLSLKLSRLIKR